MKDEGRKKYVGTDPCVCPGQNPCVGPIKEARDVGTRCFVCANWMFNWPVFILNLILNKFQRIISIKECRWNKEK